MKNFFLFLSIISYALNMPILSMDQQYADTPSDLDKRERVDSNESGPERDVKDITTRLEDLISPIETQLLSKTNQAPNEKTKQWWALFNQGKALLRQQKFQEAISFYERFTVNWKNIGGILIQYYRGVAYLEMCQFNYAYPQLTQAITSMGFKGVSLARKLHEMGIVFKDKGGLWCTIEAYKKALIIPEFQGVERAKMLYELGHLHLKWKGSNPRDACAAFEEALKIPEWQAADRARAFHEKGLLLKSLGQLEDAFLAFSHARAIPERQGAERAATLYELGMIFLKGDGGRRLAIHMLEESLGVEEWQGFDRANTIHFLGYSYLCTSLFDGEQNLGNAIESFTQALRIPEWQKVHRLNTLRFLTLTYILNRQLDLASDFLCQAEVSQKLGDFKNVLKAQMLCTHGCSWAPLSALVQSPKLKALLTFFENLGMEPEEVDRARALFRLGKTFLKLDAIENECSSTPEELELAYLCFQSALGIEQLVGVERGRAFLYSGVVMMQQENWNAAFGNFEEALEIPDYRGADRAETLFLRGIIFGNENRFNRAIADFNQALAIPELEGLGRAKILCALGYAYTQITNYPLAVRAYEQALEIPEWKGEWREPTVARLAELRERHNSDSFFYQESDSSSGSEQESDSSNNSDMDEGSE